MSNKIVLLGSGELGKELVISLQRLGESVVACDSYAGAPAMQVADEFEVINMLDGDQLDAVMAKHQPKLVIPEVESIRTERFYEYEKQGITIVPSAKAANFTMNRKAIRDLAAIDLKVKTAENLNQNQKWDFTFNPDTIHYFVLIAPKEGFSVNSAKNNTANFNSSNFSELKLKISSTFLNTSEQMIIIKNFRNSKKALDYLLAFKSNKGKIKSYKNEDFFIISPNNLKELYIEKNTNNYLEFFKQFYE